MSIITDLDRNIQALQELSADLAEVAEQKQRNAAAAKAIAEQYRQENKMNNIESEIINKAKKSYADQYLADDCMDIAIDAFYADNDHWDTVCDKCNTVLTNSNDLVQRLAAYAMAHLAAKAIADPDDAETAKQIAEMRKAGFSK